MTREHAKKLLTDPAFIAWAEGKEVQFESCSQWFKVCDGSTFADPRTKHRIKPEPKLRPWKPEEVPVGALIKYGKTTAIIAFANEDGFGFTKYVACGGNNSDTRSWNYDCVYATIEHSFNHGKTWLPCGVMEEV